MNGLTLRINKGCGKKSRNTVGFAPIQFTGFADDAVCKKNTHIKAFLQSTTTDEQLVILKKILDDVKDNSDEDVIEFLVRVFFQAEAKHPLKCFLTRHITKNANLQSPFSTKLAQHIKCSIVHEHTYKQYIETVSKVATCIENFPAGATAVKDVELELAAYLRNCMSCCVGTLRNTETLSPTEKNEIFNLAHLALRLLLYLVQKVSPDNNNRLILMFKDIRVFIKELFYDDDAPMDTKSVCGILYLSMHCLECGADSWVDVLEPGPPNEALLQLLSYEASQLSLYSAIATVVSVEKLQQQTIGEESALLTLTVKILAIGERSSSESIYILGVTRTLLQISKGLEKVTNSCLGLKLVDRLLTFIWSHLEHYMDSVRHLTAQALAHVVRYCTRLEKEGKDEALTSLFTALTSLHTTRKSYYVSLTSLATELGAVRVIERIPGLIEKVMEALSIQAVQASATTTLETLLQKHSGQTNTNTIYQSWVQPILGYVSSHTLESGVLNILENLLCRAVKLDDGVINYILPHIERTADSPYDLKCILMLLSVARKSGVTDRLAVRGDTALWKGIISYDVLKMAAVDNVDETRILSLSLIVESPKTTEVFSTGDLQFVLWYLKYNINAQSPNFRQLTLSMMKKFTKRLEDSYKVVTRLQLSPEREYYIRHLDELRQLCFDSLLPGANYSRRFVALQVLVWCEQMHLDDYQRTWREEHVDKLLLHLEDSYENNKAFALEILNKCPTTLLKDKMYSTSLDIGDILRQASALKPTECISAAYKLQLLKDKLPEYVLCEEYRCIAEPVAYSLLRRLHCELRRELSICETSIVNGAVGAPMYGLLHCMGHLITRLDANSISKEDHWTVLIRDIISTCVEVNAAVASVVNNSSPEGHLPMDMTGVVLTDHGNSGGVRLEDGRQVTAQMVLLCAWRSVKEVSLLLGEISSRLSIAGEEAACGTLDQQQMMLMGEHFTKLLAETKHRGAFEQAYVGFTKLLARLWRCRNPVLHELPRTWLTELMAAIASGDNRGTLCATRRSAGLPFMIQALVTTESQVHGNPKCFHQCMSTLLRLARTRARAQTETEREIEMRTHSTNILRALFRHAALEEAAAPSVAEGLLVALEGFEGSTWMERNSSTLLFSALVVRIFGVQRSRDTDNLCVRNRMTGRIFFLRYPQLYDFMLEKLKAASVSDDTQILRPSLYPILLLLARLYPSSLEGTVSNLKLVAYIPHVLACARSSVLKTRQLAAKAMVPLITPDQYVSHLEAMLELICDGKIKRNYCHGILLQLVRLLDARPDSLDIDFDATDRLQNKINGTLWILDQAVATIPCYVLADEYVKMMNLVLWRFPTLIPQDTVDKLETYLNRLLFNKNIPNITTGREICLSNALYLYFVILNKNKTDKLRDLIFKSLLHEIYEVVLATLNILLILYGELEIENKFQEHISMICNKDILKLLNEDTQYIESLCGVLKTSTYQECTQKCLKILSLERNTEKYIVEIKINSKNITDDILMNTLIDCIDNEQENLTHIYLECLSSFITKKLRDSNADKEMILETIRVMFACTSPDNSDETRSGVVGFLEKNCGELMKLSLEELSGEDKFEYKATLYAILVRVLEDDDATIRQRSADVISALIPSPSCMISSRCGDLLREHIARDGGVAVFVVLAVLDFKLEVCMTDEVNDECRVFDQNERYNIFLEETIWSCACADHITQLCGENANILENIMEIINNATYRNTFEKLCDSNLKYFERIVEERRKGVVSKNVLMNPKISLFLDRLCR